MLHQENQKLMGSIPQGHQLPWGRGGKTQGGKNESVNQQVMLYWEQLVGEEGGQYKLALPINMVFRPNPEQLKYSKLTDLKQFGRTDHLSQVQTKLISSLYNQSLDIKHIYFGGEGGQLKFCIFGSLLGHKFFKLIFLFASQENSLLVVALMAHVQSAVWKCMTLLRMSGRCWVA